MTKKCVICNKKYDYDKRIALFNFPKKAPPHILARWFKAAGLKVSKQVPKQNCCVCADHFRENEIVEGKNGRKILASRKIYPTINVLDANIKECPCDGICFNHSTGTTSRQSDSSITIQDSEDDTIESMQDDESEPEEASITVGNNVICLICFQNKVSSEGYSLEDQSTHSDKTLLQIFGKFFLACIDFSMIFIINFDFI